jgi:hypothetical protein
MSQKQEEFVRLILTPLEQEEISNEPTLFAKCQELYTEEFIDSVIVIAINEYRFLIKKEDHKQLPQQLLSTLMEIAEKEEMSNPVYVEVDEDGVLLLD